MFGPVSSAYSMSDESLPHTVDVFFSPSIYPSLSLSLHLPQICEPLSNSSDFEPETPFYVATQKRHSMTCFVCIFTPSQQIRLIMCSCLHGRSPINIYLNLKP